MCTPCDILDNYSAAFPGDEPVILRKHTCEGWADDGEMIPSATQSTDKPLLTFRLDFHKGDETYTQDIYAENIVEATRIALDTIATVAYWEGHPESMSVQEVEVI